jgi:aryl-alcohol dehydrogenase-like predicted oxidoreductase
MDITRTAFGTWNGGRFLKFGQPLGDERWISLVRQAWDRGVRTFLTADAYGAGEADRLLGQALSGVPRDSYCLVACIGLDFYSERPAGLSGLPRFTDSRLRNRQDFPSYLRRATELSLERCRASKFDVVLLHNPDLVGFTCDRVWNGLQNLVESGLADRLGVAPGPANGYTLDLIRCFERFGPLIDWAMVILGPLEPWPGRQVLPAARAHDIRLLTRLFDAHGLFHGDLRPGHEFGENDPRLHRPADWLEAGWEKRERIRPVAEAHRLTLLQLAAAWNLSHPEVQSVIPTLVQEEGAGAKAIEAQLDELAAVVPVRFSSDEFEILSRTGDNTGLIPSKGARRDHVTDPLPDQWSLDPELESLADRWGIDLDLEPGLDA